MEEIKLQEIGNVGYIYMEKIVLGCCLTCSVHMVMCKIAFCFLGHKPDTFA